MATPIAQIHIRIRAQSRMFTMSAIAPIVQKRERAMTTPRAIAIPKLSQTTRSPSAANSVSDSIDEWAGVPLAQAEGV